MAEPVGDTSYEDALAAMQAEIAAREAEAFARRNAIAVRRKLNLKECGDTASAPTAGEILASMLELLDAFSDQSVFYVLSEGYQGIMSDLTSAVTRIKTIANTEATTAIDYYN
jgi:hypothetical protein